MNRSDALGIAERRAAAQREGKRHLEKLKPGMWLAVQDRSVTEGDQFWLGQAFAIPNRQGSSCVHKAVVDRSEWIAGSEFGRGDFAVAVKWWAKTASDTEERTYEEWAPSIEDKENYGIEYATTGGDQGHYFIFNATELRLVNFNMETTEALQVGPQFVSRRTRAGRASSVRQATATVGCTFRLPVDIENQILATCW